MDGITTFILLTLLPIATTLLVYFLLNFPLKSISEKFKKTIVGIIFGGCIIGQILLSFEISFIEISPLASTIVAISLMFGIGAILVAGSIGIGYLSLSLLWASDTMNTLTYLIIIVCISSISILYSKFITKYTKAKWTSFLFGGLGSAIILFLIEATIHYDDVLNYYVDIWEPFLLLIIMNCIVAILIWLIEFIFNKENYVKDRKKKDLSSAFQIILSISISVAFLVATIINFAVTSNISNNNAADLIERYSMPTKQEIIYETDQNLIEFSEYFYQALNLMINDGTISNQKITQEIQRNIRYSYFFSNVMVLERNGNIKYCIFDDAINHNISEYEALNCFYPLLQEEIDDYIMDEWINEAIIETTNVVKYVGHALSGNYVLIYDISTRAYDRLFIKTALQFQSFRLVGEGGGIIFVDKDGKELSADSSPLMGNSKKDLDIDIDLTKIEYHKLLKAKLNGEEVLFECEKVDFNDYIVITYIPLCEVYFERNISTIVNISFLIIIFLMLFILIYMLVQDNVVKKITSINHSLTEIRNGNLEAKASELSLKEFEFLSNGINATVSSLKGYIEAEKNRLREELVLARLIQQSVLPNYFEVDNENVEFFAKMIPSKEVGGDFFDYYILDKHKLAFVIADVSGKGIPGAMFMMQSKAMLKDFAQSSLEPNEILDKTNNELCKNNSSQMFVTAWLGVLDTQTGVLEFANAGHNPPLICDENGVEILKTKHNFVLAGMENYKYKKEQITLKEGAILFLYTDGITDAQNLQNEFYGLNNLKNTLNNYKSLTMKSLCEQVLIDVGNFTGQANQFDDETILALKFIGGKNQNKIVIPANSNNVPELYKFIDAQLIGDSISQEFKNKIKIIIDEIASNIIKFSHSLVVELNIDKMENGIQICFTDFGQPFNPLNQIEPDTTLSSSERAIGGLGIHIVKKFADEINYSYENQKNILKIFKKY